MKVIAESEVTEESKRISLGGVLWRIGVVLLVVIIGILVLGFSVMGVIINGPSIQARDLFVTTCMETSFAKKFPPLYLSADEIKSIQNANAVLPTNEITDIKTEFEEQVDEAIPDIEVIDVFGPTYKGKMMIVKDPSRLTVGIPPEYGLDKQGEKLQDMIKKENAVGGINGGGFVDVDGVGKGGAPLGIVIKDGKFLYNEGATCDVIGFDENNMLHVGVMTTEQVKERKIKNAVSFGPALVINGKPTKMTGSSGGLNPRTAIGQRADGVVLMLVIDGRQPHSLGANFKDLVDIMVKYGAVNAANLDGGSSSMMYYNDELVTVCSSLYGPRKLPTAFLVR